jgi:hypothetical protein
MIEYEVADEEVRDDRVAQVWCVAGAFKRDQPRMRDCVRYGSPARRSDDRILRPLDDQGRTSYLGAELEDIFSVIGPLRVQAAQDGLRIGLQARLKEIREAVSDRGGGVRSRGERPPAGASPKHRR